MTSSTFLTEDKIRMFLMDKKELNPLLNGVRWSPQDIQLASELAVDKFNTSPPVSGASYSIESFPYTYLLLTGISALLLRSASINQANNNLTYNAQGIQVDDMNKAGVFMQLSDRMWEEFLTSTKEIKMNQATRNLFGTISSEYSFRL